ncbi:PTS fructose transporter subunit IIB [Pantoea sp. B65]|uniref:PTS fructose transporter subunit IIB n=1 Tax=Pantoea sp. B65 TaxID=2813359 RepID=UPI0039B61DD1
MSTLHATTKLNIVAVTACVTGVAHTYMAAERLEKLAKEYSFNVKIETQGVLGIKGKLTSADVEKADVVIIASDININEPDRFTHCRLINVKISALLLHPETVISSIKKIARFPRNTVIDM